MALQAPLPTADAKPVWPPTAPSLRAAISPRRLAPVEGVLVTSTAVDAASRQGRLGHRPPAGDVDDTASIVAAAGCHCRMGLEVHLESGPRNSMTRSSSRHLDGRMFSQDAGGTCSFAG
jgi:hypothetical protein